MAENYDIHFCKLEDGIGKYLQYSSYVIISDETVAGLYASRIKDVLASQKKKVLEITFPVGEHSKNLTTVANILSKLAAAHVRRDACIIALGGGISGDVAGFVASIYLRGVDYIQIPTTVIAQSDSAIGGKTGVNLFEGKNLVGCFYNPKAVIIDIQTLETLPQVEFINGLAEVVKYGIISQPDLFLYLESNFKKILARDFETLKKIIEMSIETKIKIVAKDPHEKGLRRILNFGHTIAHAVEKESRFEIRHGEAVAIGMMIAARIARKKTGFTLEDVKRLRTLLEKFGLPVKLPPSVPTERLLEATMVDKKSSSSGERYTLPKKIGHMADFDGTYVTEVEKDILIEVLHESK